MSACTDSSRAILHDSPFPTGMAIPYLARIGNLGESLYATSPMTPNALGVEPSAFYPLVSFNFHTYKIKFQWYQIMGPRVDSDSVEKIGRYSIMRGPDLSLFVSANLRDFSLFFGRAGWYVSSDFFLVKPQYQISSFMFPLSWSWWLHCSKVDQILVSFQNFNKLPLFQKINSQLHHLTSFFLKIFEKRILSVSKKAGNYSEIIINFL